MGTIIRRRRRRYQRPAGPDPLEYWLHGPAGLSREQNAAIEDHIARFNSARLDQWRAERQRLLQEEGGK